jgi:RND family efflux transporter MFP subunit
MGAPAEGIVAKITVDRSSSVTRGQVLVELESSVERTALEKAEAMTTFDGDIKMQRTQLAFAKRVHKRVKLLTAISAHDKDQAATEIALTRYRLDKARESRTLTQLELKKARAVIDRRSIRSPITGVVVERYVSPGEYVNSQPLLRVAQIDPLRVEVIVPGAVFGRILPGMTATIVPELPGYGAQTATVTIVDRVIDSASSTFGVRLELPNPGQRMPSGLKCTVQFDIDPPLDNLTKTKPRIVAGQTQKPKPIKD